MKHLIFSVVLLFCLSCKKEEIPTCQDETSLYSLADYPIGVAIDFMAFEYDSIYKQKATAQFNSFTPENIFKADYLHPEENYFDWSAADSLVDFCIAYNKRLHGHTLIWHQQIPSWIENFQGDELAWELMMKTHIQTIVTHFKGKVTAWDVVNEAFEEDGTLRNSIWREKIGDDYIQKAFQYAHEADPDALLFYNDYNLESNNKKRKAVLEFFTNMHDSGVQIDGIGMQTHIDVCSARSKEIVEAFGDVVEANYLLHISELDIAINPKGKKINNKQDSFHDQAILLGEIVKGYNNLPPALQYGITFWGVSDTQSWIRTYYNREDYPLLYDDNYQVKPCYCILKKHLPL